MTLTLELDDSTLLKRESKGTIHLSMAPMGGVLVEDTGVIGTPVKYVSTFTVADAHHIDLADLFVEAMRLADTRQIVTLDPEVIYEYVESGFTIPAEVTRMDAYPSDWSWRRKRTYQDANGHCEECGRRGEIHAHHITPRSEGGSDALSNLRAVCPRCHRSSHDHSIW